MIDSLFEGVLVGLLVAIPIGPVGVLCVRRALLKGWLAGFVSGLGAAAVNGVYASIGAFSVVLILDFIQRELEWIRIGGALVMIVIGVYTIVKSTKYAQKQLTVPASLFKDFSSTALLALTNPSLALTFLVIFAAFGLAGKEGSFAEHALLVLGVMVGVALWWLILCLIAERLRSRITEKGMKGINVFGGITILLFAAFLLAQGPWEKYQLDQAEQTALDEEAASRLEAAQAAGAHTVSETAVMTLNGVRIPFSSVHQEDDGAYKGTLHFPDYTLDVRAGDTFSVGEKTYIVYDIWCDGKDHCAAAVLESSPQNP